MNSAMPFRRLATFARRRCTEPPHKVHHRNPLFGGDLTLPENF